MTTELQPVTLLTGFPSGWSQALGARLQQEGRRIVWCADDPALAEASGGLRAASDGSDCRAALDRLPQRGERIETALIAALANPAAASLDTALQALETAVVQNTEAPMRWLNAVMADMLPRGAGQILLVTWDPRACAMPTAAAAHGTVRAIAVYAESLRPALSLRGIQLKTLLLGPATHEAWDRPNALEKLGAAISEFLKDASRERRLRL